MSFNSDLASCMYPLPAPNSEGMDELIEFLDQLHSAWENSGGEADTTIMALVAAGAVVGIDEAALAAAGAATVLTYITSLTLCAARGLSSSVWDWITADATPTWLQSNLMAQAQAQGIAPPDSGEAIA
jgi:hypothetical protein